MRTAKRATADPDAWILDGGGEMGDLIRATDWAATPLGPIRDWSRILKATVAMLVHSRHPMFLWWGPDLIQIYNDAYVPSFGVGKHPPAMGQPGRDCWPEIWHIIGPRSMPSCSVACRSSATAPSKTSIGRTAYSPVFDDDGRIGGALVVCTETTARVVATDREAALRAEVKRDRIRLQQFFVQAPAGICILRGADLTFEFANDYYRALVGRRDLVGKPLLSALPELYGATARCLAARGHAVRRAVRRPRGAGSSRSTRPRHA